MIEHILWKKRNIMYAETRARTDRLSIGQLRNENSVKRFHWKHKKITFAFFITIPTKATETESSKK